MVIITEDGFDQIKRARQANRFSPRGRASQSNESRRGRKVRRFQRERRVMRQHAAGKSPEPESTGLPAFVSATEVQ